SKMAMQRSYARTSRADIHSGATPSCASTREDRALRPASTATTQPHSELISKPASPRTPRLATSSTVESHPARPPRSSGGVETDPGLVGQVGDPFWPQHPWKGTKHSGQAPGRHHRHALGDDLAPGNL